jgi:hypothetical protein
MKIELTNEEAQVLINLIDVAVKSAGLQAAEAGVFYTKKIQEAAKAEQPVAEMPEPMLDAA